MWNGELLELLVEKGYWKAIRAKLLHIVNETFYLILINGANCRYLDRQISGASAARCKLEKKTGTVAMCRPPL